ncbi:hypothetical protein HW555_003200 [Spodoptera exigua]|uniref:Uncharacterized protein n=1 Tax=Spodoptera exigua TaxID=7107 RepID=A0A835GLR8_SPOEX|nr:hypothetical protein HW555_003200 [Spodoptera exigua]
MEAKSLIVLLAVLFCSVTPGRPIPIFRSPCQCPPKHPCISKLVTPFPAIVDTIDNIPNPQCCCCKDQLILPPLAVELPRSLGYFQSALPLVAKYFSPSLATSQILRPPPYTRPIVEQIMENGKFINLPPNVITESPNMNIIPMPNIVPSPRTTVITDCSPSICENLANTIQLMIVCNLLQNKYSSDFANKLTVPVINDVLSSPALSYGFNNVISPNTITPKIVAPNIPPSNIIGNYIPPNFYPNVINPSVISSVPSVIPPKMISPNVIMPNVIPPGVIPTAVSPTCPNAPQVTPANVNALLNTLMGMLGNIRS